MGYHNTRSSVDFHSLNYYIVIIWQVEETCMVALATAYNARETEGGTTKQELLHFVEEVSGVYGHLCTCTCMHMHTH